MLDDKSITLLNIPPLFGEVRWIAAEAVVAVRTMMGVREPVTLEDTFDPVTDVDRLAAEAGVPRSTLDGFEGAIDTLQKLAAAGRLQRRRLIREPKVRNG